MRGDIGLAWTTCRLIAVMLSSWSQTYNTCRFQRTGLVCLPYTCWRLTLQRIYLWHAGVDSFEVTWQENKVVASGNFDVDALVAKLNKSGKETSIA
jgi:hypothetical protein